jgi:hypothetical protein
MGSMALFPTQQSTWSALQQEVDQTKRTACGHPGVNGGYFDPSLKFGVNCYGIKPVNKGTILPAPMPGVDPNALNKFKGMLGSMKLSPFNRDIWSEKGELALEAKNARKNVTGIVGTLEKDISSLGSQLESSL